ncbi:MAG: urea ABC transporter permease subunit UrtB, partial [Alphaproteobacteria bacterium]|nr:urea ABC transporter permease subunit UrtB [Alphaproteobacteria bacterium]
MRALSLALFALLLLPRLAWAAPLDELIRKLGAEDFSTKLEAIEALGALGEGGAIPALKALSDGTLVATSDGRVAIATQSGAVDALSGEKLELPGAERVRANNRLRGAVTAALAKLQLFSADPAERLAAAREALKTGAAPATLDRALEKETVAAVRAALSLARAASALRDGPIEDRVKAAESLSSSTDPQIRSLLLGLAGDAAAPAEVAAAANAAAAKIEFRLKLVGVAENIFQGLSLGSVLLLAAIGLAITFGVMGVINMAHGEMIMIGAYAAYVVQEVFRALAPAAVGWYLPVAVPVAFLVAGAVGVALERTVIRWLYGRPLETMLATWGISLILQQAVRSIFGAPNKEVANPVWMTGGFEVVGGFLITWNRAVIIVFCFAVLAGIALLL